MLRRVEERAVAVAQQHADRDSPMSVRRDHVGLAVAVEVGDRQPGGAIAGASVTGAVREAALAVTQQHLDVTASARNHRHRR